MYILESKRHFAYCETVIGHFKRHNMATTTATIFIGHAHQNNSGINPSHFIQFTENDRPALIPTQRQNQKSRFLPTLYSTTDKISYFVIDE